MISNYHENSREAFASMMPVFGTLDDLILSTLDRAGTEGMIAQDLVFETGRKYQAVTGNVAHLKKRGLIVESGEKRRTLSNRNAAVLICAWHAPTEEGPKTQKELFASER